MTLWTGQHIEVTDVPIGDPNLYHLTLEWLEAIGTVLMCACFALMGVGFAQAHLAVAQDPMHGLLGSLLACSYVLRKRSAGSNARCC